MASEIPCIGNEVLHNILHTYPYDIILDMPDDEVCPTCLDNYANGNAPDQCRAIKLHECGHIVGDRCFNEWAVRQTERHCGRCLNWNHELKQVDWLEWDLCYEFAKSEHFRGYASIEAHIIHRLNMSLKSNRLVDKMVTKCLQLEKQREYRDVLAMRCTKEVHRYLKYSSRVFLGLDMIKTTTLIFFDTVEALIIVRLYLYAIRLVIEWLSPHACFYYHQRPMDLAHQSMVLGFIGFPETAFSMPFRFWQASLWPVLFWLSFAFYVAKVIVDLVRHVRITDLLLDLALARNFDGEGAKGALRRNYFER
ncbi:hypothetical protein CC80DRAFT_544420 [Byssothecium circinans]|uniref:RING-type domain-containing protein n=1 Tax=Byssothecium circinans TaxID=147558 RepID=A0A6A5U7A5_9PLEO|nr:hypothetical protein CC80DRAFT_544420 [Byssothecium circinans]